MDSTESQSLLAEMTWQEAELAFDEADFVVLPCGATEQHSTHLPTSVDTIRAKHLTAELADAASEYDLDLLVLPVLPYGYSEHHLNYSGTVSVGADTYQEIIIDIGRSVQRHGATRFLVTNFHAGNIEPHKLALDRLQRDHDLDSYYVHWTDFARERLEERFGSEWGHAGEYETSVIEHYRPELVHAERKTPQTKKNRYEVRQYSHFDDLTVEGGLGDPTQSDPVFLAEVIEETTDDILGHLRSERE
ncbi:creatinine amidohydrolase [Halogranum rubrum]|uniref:Creatinine amidohydrolase n=2 Tax=Halogranum rubrum TaxID=553466 RepID=A0A1I4FE40_9EURY|nr:creatinine amidohydrolase [Halogranum rubrum]